MPDDDAAVYAALVRPTATGVSITPNVRVSAGTANAAAASNNIDLGDYTGLDFYNGTFYPVWADNSGTGGKNPDGPARQLDLYTAAVAASSFPAADRTVLGGFSGGAGPAARLVTTGYTAVTRGSGFAFKVNYVAGPGVDRTSPAGGGLTVTGPAASASPRK